jgi:uncharacterized protein
MGSINFRHLPDVIAFFIGVTAQWSVVRALPNSLARNVLAGFGALWIGFGFLFTVKTMAQLLPYSPVLEWVRGLAIVYAMLITVYAVLRAVMVQAKVIPAEIQPTRREALVALVPVAFGGYGVFIEPNRMRMVETKLIVPGLAPDLNGLRIAQITDIHFGAYFGRRALERAVAMANETRPQLTMVTGDLISIRRDPLDDCLALLKKLKAEAGIYGCLGNHEIAADCEDYATEAAARIGIKMLRAEQTLLRFGQADLNLAGVDYQRISEEYLDDALPLLRPDATNLLLSHNPDVFPTAAAQGWDVMLAGHTHGGQVDVEILGEHLDPARFFTPFIYGRYEQAGKQLLVSRGLGTVGAPIRAGAPPEVNLIQLVQA